MIKLVVIFFLLILHVVLDITSYVTILIRLKQRFISKFRIYFLLFINCKLAIDGPI